VGTFPAHPAAPPARAKSPTARANLTFGLESSIVPEKEQGACRPVVWGSRLQMLENADTAKDSWFGLRTPFTDRTNTLTVL
jgi:hypothetical protein